MQDQIVLHDTEPLLMPVASGMLRYPQLWGDTDLLFANAARHPKLMNVLKHQNLLD
jgi:hypothetical protein